MMFVYDSTATVEYVDTVRRSKYSYGRYGTVTFFTAPARESAGQFRETAKVSRDKRDEITTPVE